MVLVCHVIWQDHITKGSSNLSGHHPTKFGGHRHCSIADIMVLIRHAISQDHVMKGSRAFTGTNPSR